MVRIVLLKNKKTGEEIVMEELPGGGVGYEYEDSPRVEHHTDRFNVQLARYQIGNNTDWEVSAP